MISKENESIRRHYLREDTLHSKQHQALIDTINHNYTELVSKEEILEELKESMTEDFDEEDPSFAPHFRMVDNILSQLGSVLKDGERYYFARDTFYPIYEDDEFNEFDYLDNVKHTVIKVKLTPEDIAACKDRGGDWINTEFTIFEDGVIVIDWDTYIGYGDCLIPERLVGSVKQDDESDDDDEANELDLDF